MKTTKATKLSSAAKAVQAVDLSTLNNKQRRIMKKISASSIKFGEYDHPVELIKNAEIYIKAARQGRVVCCIHSVAASGMSRKASLRVMEKQGQGGKFSFLYFNPFASLITGDKRDRNGDLILTGCGFDVVWDLNYRIMNILCNLGFISKKECESLEQERPHDC